jgi:hypothetical protein
MDFSKIPAFKSIFIKDGFYDLVFEVENAVVPNPHEVMGEARGNGDDTDNGNENSRGLRERDGV